MPNLLDLLFGNLTKPELSVNGKDQYYPSKDARDAAAQGVIESQRPQVVDPMPTGVAVTQPGQEQTLPNSNPADQESYIPPQLQFLHGPSDSPLQSAPPVVSHEADPSFKQASTDSLGQISAKSPALTKKGALMSILLGGGLGAAAGAGSRTFGQGFQTAQEFPLQQAGQKLGLQHEQIQNQQAIANLPWQQAKTQLELQGMQAKNNLTTAQAGAIPADVALKGAETAKAQYITVGDKVLQLVPGQKPVEVTDEKVQIPLDAYSASFAGLQEGTKLPLKEAKEVIAAASSHRVDPIIEAQIGPPPAGGSALAEWGKKAATIKASMQAAPRISVMNAQQNAGGGLSPEALDQAAEKYNMTGQLPSSRGVGGLAQIRQIMNRSAELHPGESLAGNSAISKANQASLAKVQANLDQVTAFERTAGRNIDQFLAQAQKVIDTGTPLLNVPVRQITGKMGGVDQSTFDAARTVALTEAAKVLNNPGTNGQLSDSARHEVESLSPESATLPQIVAVMKILKKDMANRHEEYQAVVNDIQGRYGKTKNSGQASASSAPKINDTQVHNGDKYKFDGTQWVRQNAQP